MTKFSLHKEGLISIGICILATIISFYFSPFIGMFGAIISTMVVYFFRDPQRVVPLNSEIIVSPADGVVCKIEKAFPPEVSEITEEMHKISIFLSPLNVHVNRMPVDGVVTQTKYTPGKKIRADYDSADGENERQEVVVQMENGEKIVVVQQTGFLARRIVCYPRAGDRVSQGMRYGIIKFGSRVTVYLPLAMTLNVSVQQTLVAGETILAVTGDSIPIVSTHILD